MLKRTDMRSIFKVCSRLGQIILLAFFGKKMKIFLKGFGVYGGGGSSVIRGSAKLANDNFTFLAFA
jgi:hypothetical protein